MGLEILNNMNVVGDFELGRHVADICFMHGTAQKVLIISHKSRRYLSLRIRSRMNAECEQHGALYD